MDKFVPLLHMKWKKHEEVNKIIGYWIEDFNEYTIKVPSQLRDLLIELQNGLSEKYSEMIELENDLRKYKQDFSSIFKGDLDGN